jgi:hypothetical protein
MRWAILAAGLWAGAGAAGAQTVDVPGTGPVAVPGTDLTAVLVAVTDFRCPSDLDCYWEGEKRVTLSIAGPGGAVQEIEMCNMCEGATDKARAFGVGFMFEDLLPEKDVIEALGREATVADYAARVRVGD